MIIIKPVENKSDQEKYCALCGIIYDPDAHAYAAHDERVFVCVAQFKIIGQYGYIYDIAEPYGIDNSETVSLTARAVLNFMDLCGVPRVRMLTDYKNIPELLKFNKNSDNDWELFLSGYFLNSEKCENRN